MCQKQMFYSQGDQGAAKGFLEFTITRSIMNTIVELLV